MMQQARDRIFRNNELVYKAAPAFGEGGRVAKPDTATSREIVALLLTLSIDWFRDHILVIAALGRNDRKLVPASKKVPSIRLYGS